MAPMLDCVIIGAGQSGLCAAKRLAELGVPYIAVERARIGEAWHSRMPDMELFTSREFCALPGLAFPGEQDGYPTAAEVARYLEDYAKQFNLRVQEHTEVAEVFVQDGIFVTRTAQGVEYRSKTLLNATGSNQVCVVPDMASDISAEVQQMTAANDSFAELPDACRVLIAGDGASGRQIAAKLARRAKVTLATGSSRGLPPNRVLGKDLFWWLKNVGILFADSHSLVAKILKKRNPVPCRDFNNRRLRKLGVEIVGRLESFSETTAIFADGRSEFDAVIWALGYRDHTAWLKVPDAIANGDFIQQYGRTPQPGLYVVGYKWLSCRASELLMGAEKDVNLVISHLRQYLQNNGTRS